MSEKSNGHRPVSDAEIAWAKHVSNRDDSGLRVDPVELALLREIVARWREADAARAKDRGRK